MRPPLKIVGGWFSQSEWMVRLLNLSRAEEPPSQPGLVLIQIDGLGWTEFRRGLRKGGLPFLKRLGKAHGYVSQPHYSGLPSNTPGVQGALFYGVDACVPAFSFVSRDSQKVCHMFDSAAAAAVEARLKEQGEPLLAGGSSYGNIFSGGADATHYCSTSMGWVGLFKALNPPALALAILLNLHVVVRAAFLAALEIWLALIDCARGILTGYALRKEIVFIPLRVAICIVLREVVTAAVRIDIARGLKIIHVNLAGYDEQAHQRGPGSALARWSLRGIDSSIARIWKAATRSHVRPYHVWIYSDHGQEDTLPYPKEHGRSIQTAVTEVFDAQMKERGWGIEHVYGTPHWRANLLGIPRLIRRLAPAAEAAPSTDKPPQVMVAAMGPVGHIYAPQELTPEAKTQLGEALVSAAKIPLVMAAGAPGQARAWTADGVFELPKDARKILGENHPYTEEVGADLARLCHHPDAGTFVISGWRQGRSGTFPMEAGGHAGPGPEETNGFCYAPAEALKLPEGREYVRNEDLRKAARRILARAS